MQTNSESKRPKWSAAAVPALIGGLCLAGCLAAPVLGAVAAGAVSGALFGPVVAAGVAVAAVLAAIVITHSRRRKASCGCGSPVTPGPASD